MKEEVNVKRIKLCVLLLSILCLLASAVSAKPSNLQVGEMVPDFTLINQKGAKVSLSDFRGKGVIISFLYTQCPYPDKCAMIGQKLRNLAELGKKIGNESSLQVVAITLDPVHDKPEVLKEYAQGFDAEHKNWSFLTGSEDDIARVAGAFGVIYWTEKGVIEHNMRTAFVDPTGKLQILKSGSEWKPGVFAAEVKPYLSK